MTWSPRLTRAMDGSELQLLALGLPVVDDYLQFVGARCRLNTWLATAYDLLVFFSVIPKYPSAVTTTDVFAFLEAQRNPRADGRVVRLEDRERGLAVRTIKRRLASVSGLFAYLVARGDAGVTMNPVPRGLATRRAGSGAAQRGVPLLRTPRTLPRVLAPETANLFLAALRTHRDRAMAEAMLFGGLRPAHLPPAAAHLLDAAARGGHGPRGRAGPGRPPLDRVDPHLPASGQRLAGPGVHPRRWTPSRLDLGDAWRHGPEEL